MTYNAFSGTLKPTQSICDVLNLTDRRRVFFCTGRFGGNRQHWTFLLEMLSLLPEEVRCIRVSMSDLCNMISVYVEY